MPEALWTTPLPELVDLLALEDLGDDVYDARHSRASITSRHVFGGLVAAQALVAAGSTVAGDRTVHSLHSYFLRPGDPDLPLHLEVRRTRDGRSFSHRRVDAVQGGRTIMELSCSFAVELPGVQHQLAMPVVAQPEQVRPDHELLAELPEVTSPYGRSLDSFELRTAGLGPGWFQERAPVGEPSVIWKRAAGPTPESPLVQAALLTYASDMRILHPALRPHGRSMYDADVRPATIDHAVWFHAVPAVSDWTLWYGDAPWADHGRAFVRSSVFDRAGRLVAHATQEGLLRL